MRNFDTVNKIRILTYNKKHMSALDDFEIEPGKQIPLGFKLEIMNPKVGCLVGAQYWEADGQDDYNTFKLHFLWIALRWDWE
jgi:hypothetical protein